MGNLDDILSGPEWEAFERDVEEEMIPKLARSKIALPLYSGKWDVKLAVEIGAMILMDKPIIVMATHGIEVPRGLRRVADKVIYVGDLSDPTEAQRVHEELELVMERLFG